MIDLIVALLFLAGAALMAIAGMGLVRMPDLPTRMHASSKAGALAGGLMAVAVAVHFEDGGVTARAIAVAIFIVLTSPISAHVIGRAAYICRVPVWERTQRNDLRGRYHPRSRALSSKAQTTPPEDK